MIPHDCQDQVPEATHCKIPIQLQVFFVMFWPPYLPRVEWPCGSVGRMVSSNRHCARYFANRSARRAICNLAMGAAARDRNHKKQLKPQTKLPNNEAFSRLDASPLWRITLPAQRSTLSAFRNQESRVLKTDLEKIPHDSRFELLLSR